MQSSTETQKPCVLFVDDDAAVLANLRRGLWREPLEVITASGPEAALVVLRERTVDVVVSDEKMPHMGGAELLTLVRQLYPETCRILLSGHADVDAALRAINEARVFRFLTKPCPPREIAACINDALAAREQRHALERAAGDNHRESAARTRRLAEVLPTVWLAIQPIVHASSGEVFAYETLARCEHPEVRTPLALFDLAEESGAVIEVERVLRLRMAELLRTLPSDVLLFVNTHPHSLTDPDFFDDRNPLVPFASRVVLEIIERDAVAGGATTTQRISTLRGLGFRVAIDDLGAGYNGLNTFTDVLPDVVKFDMALVRGVEESPVKARLLSALIDMCTDLGIITVAEGIETAAERDAVRALGCDMLQGFFFGQPKRPTRELRKAG